MSAELFDAVFGTTAIEGVIDDAAIIDALCEAETALARACARVGLIALPIALEVAAACEAVRGSDLHELARRSLVGGNPVIPLVAELRARVESRAGAEAARAVHFGASSQDILDTALMLVAKRALGVIIAGLGECGEAAATLAHTHRDTAMVARTLLYQAVPTSFGALAAVWGTGLDRARRRLSTVRASLPVQLGGDAGTLLPMYPHGLTILTVFADETELAEPDGVWHTDRTPITELAGALGTAAAAIGKVATDIVVLASSDIGELQEPQPSRFVGYAAQIGAQTRSDRGGNGSCRCGAGARTGRDTARRGLARAAARRRILARRSGPRCSRYCVMSAAPLPGCGRRSTSTSTVPRWRKTLPDTGIASTSPISAMPAISSTATSTGDTMSERSERTNVTSLPGRTSAARLGDISASIAVPAFMVSELTTSFRMGLTIFIPLLLVDLLVSAILMSLG